MHIKHFTIKLASELRERDNTMPDYKLSFDLVDTLNGVRRRSYNGTFADHATATVAAGDFLTDMDAASEAQIANIYLAERILYSSVQGPQTVFMVADATIELDDGGRANFKVPAPTAALFAGNALDPTATEWTNLMANFASGAGWTISDGENYLSTIRGKRAFDKSGATNLS